MKSGKIRTAIIGLGRITHGYEKDALALFGMKFATHWSVLREHPGFFLAAVADVSPRARADFRTKAAKEKRDVAVYADWQKMIETEKLELVVVATNTESHAEICSRLIDLGVKNILCEKPLSSSLKEAEALVKKAKKNGCNLFVNYFRAFTPSYLKLIEKVRDGSLGRIQSFEVKYTKGIINNATHFIDLLARMFGEVKRAEGFKNPTIKNLREDDPTLSAVIEFKNGVSGYIHGLNNNFYNIFELDILGELGRVRIVNEKPEFYLPRISDKVRWYTGLKQKPDWGLTTVAAGLYPVYENIYVSNNLCSGEDSLKSLRIADKIIRSVEK